MAGKVRHVLSHRFSEGKYVGLNVFSLLCVRHTKQFLEIPRKAPVKQPY